MELALPTRIYLCCPSWGFPNKTNFAHFFLLLPFCRLCLVQFIVFPSSGSIVHSFMSSSQVRHRNNPTAQQNQPIFPIETESETESLSEEEIPMANIRHSIEIPKMYVIWGENHSNSSRSRFLSHSHFFIL